MASVRKVIFLVAAVFAPRVPEGKGTLSPPAVCPDGVVLLTENISLTNKTAQEWDGCEEIRGTEGVIVSVAEENVLLPETISNITGPIRFKGVREAPRTLLTGGNLTISAPLNTTVQFLELHGSGWGGALRVAGSLQLETEGTEHLGSCLGQLRGMMEVESCSEEARDGPGRIEFINCSSVELGGAVFADGNLSVINEGHVIFERCAASGLAAHGGALYTKRNLLIKNAGWLEFENCSANNAGGALFAISDLQLNNRGKVSFVRCWVDYRAGSGAAMAVATGDVNIVANGGIIIADCADGPACKFSIFAAVGVVNFGQCRNDSSAISTVMVHSRLSETICKSVNDFCPPGTQAKFEEGDHHVRACSGCPPETVLFRAPTLDLTSGHGTVCTPCLEIYERFHKFASVKCLGGSGATAANGIMLRQQRIDSWDDKQEPGIEAMRCPNPRVCLGERTLFMHPNGTVEGIASMCGIGHNGTSRGCSTCLYPDYGRSLRDPFVCEKCGAYWLSVLYFVLPQTFLLALGLHSASQVDDASNLATQVKITTSFASLAGLPCMLLFLSDGYEDFKFTFPWGRSAAGRAHELGAGIQGISYSGSPDCFLYPFLERQSSGIELFLFAMILPGVTLIIIIIGTCSTECIEPSTPSEGGVLLHDNEAQDNTPITVHWKMKLLQRLIVWQNLFYPRVVAGFVSLVPCVSFHTREWHQALDTNEDCPNAMPSSFSMVVSGIGLPFLIVTGPVMWAWLIYWRSQSWEKKTREATLRFLIKSYNKDHEWWEATVLSRNMLVQAMASKVPPSYAPGRLALWLLVIVGAAAIATSTRPFIHESANRLELRCLSVSALSIIIAACTLNVWYGESPLWWFGLASSALLLLGLTLAYLTYLILPELTREMGKKAGCIVEDDQPKATDNVE